MFNPMQIIQMLSSGNVNPAQMMNMFSGNPMMQQAQKMLQGKNPQQMQETIFNIAKQKGIDENQLKQMAQQFGIKL